MLECVRSINGIPIRLSEERWSHILLGHPELAPYQSKILETITNPERVLEGEQGELLAVCEFSPNKWLVVAYRELIEDGFVITAFTTRRQEYLNKRRQLCP